MKRRCAWRCMDSKTTAWPAARAPPMAGSPSMSTGSGEAFNFSRAETALVCVLLLRGPQTPGELRGRTERMHRFEEIADVLAGLQKLMEREPSLAVMLPRQPGTKESRYAHLLSGPVEAAAAATPMPVATYVPTFSGEASDQDGRLAQLEATVAQLKSDLENLRKRFDDLFA